MITRATVGTTGHPWWFAIFVFDGTVLWGNYPGASSALFTTNAIHSFPSRSVCS